MGKRKGGKETLISSHESGENDDEGVEVVDGGKGARFFACYLLTSLSPRFKGHTYIGFTVNPRRRIRQHNGEIGSGAWRTKRKRPWEMVVCIYGFPTNVAALQFEWAWQHPVESLAVRSAAASFKSLSGIANKIKLAYTMLSLPAWNSLNLSVNFFSTKYKKHTSGCPTLPQQMRTHVCLMDELPCYNGNNVCVNDEFGGGEDDLTDTLRESTEESIEAGRKAIDSPSSHLSSEEIIQKQINKEDDMSLGCRACLEENWIGSLKNLRPIRDEDQRQPFILDSDSPYVRASSSLGTSFYNTVSSYVADKQIPISVEEFTLELTVEEFTVELNKKQLTPTSVAGKDQVSIKSPCIPRKVEVIDIFTPSPCYTINSGSKKRRPAAYPEVIDLTNSPMFV